jgi:hypothetical protein
LAWPAGTPVGHGTRRLTQRYNVVLAHADHPLPPVLMWPEQDAGEMPLAARRSRRRKGGWFYSGDEAAVSRLADRCDALGAKALGFQTVGDALMVWDSRRGRRDDYTRWLKNVPQLLTAVTAAGEADSATPSH